MSGLIVINSRDRKDKTSPISNFNINLSAGYQFKTAQMELIQVVMPISHYTIMTGINDTLEIGMNSTTYTITLTQRNHTTFSTLATDLQTQLNAAPIPAPDRTFTVTFDTTTEKFTIAHGAKSFSLNFSVGRLFRHLGFRELDTALLTTHTSPLMGSLQFGQAYIIHCNEIASGIDSFVYPVASQFNKGPFVGTVPLTGNFGYVMTYEPKRESRDLFDYDNVRNFEEINIRVSFEDGGIFVPLNLDWHMVFRYKIPF